MKAKEEFELILRKVTGNDYWMSIMHISTNTGMTIHMDHDDVVILRDHMTKLIDAKDGLE